MDQAHDTPDPDQARPSGAFRVFAPFAIPAVLWQGVAALTGSIGIGWRILAVAAGFGALAWTRHDTGRLARPVAALVTAGLFWMGALEAAAQATTLLPFELAFFPAAAAAHVTVFLRLTQPAGPEGPGLLDRALSGLALSAAVLLFALFALEGAARVTRGIVTYDTLADDPGLGAAFFRPPDRRARGIPGYTGKWAHRDFSGVRVELNDWGLRGGPDHAGPPGEGQRAVVVLGDSFSFGLGVPAEATYAQRLDDALDARVYNAGIPGYGMFEERHMLADVATVVRPAVVVLGLYQGNDFADSASAADRAVPPAEPAEPGSLPGPPRRDPVARLRDDVRRKAWWKDRSALLQLGSRRGIGLPSRFGRESLTGDPDGIIPPLVEHGIEELRTLEANVSALGAELVVLLIPNGIQSEPDRYEEWLALLPAAERAGCHRTRFHEQLAARLRAEGFRVVDPLPALDASALEGRSGFHREGHWNGTGHGIAAELLEPVVAELLPRVRRN